MDSIQLGISVLIRDKDGFPVFPHTRADVRYVNTNMGMDKVMETTSECFLSYAKRSLSAGEKILDHYIKYE